MHKIMNFHRMHIFLVLTQCSIFDLKIRSPPKRVKYEFPPCKNMRPFSPENNWSLHRFKSPFFAV